MTARLPASHAQGAQNIGVNRRAGVDALGVARRAHADARPALLVDVRQFVVDDAVAVVVEPVADFRRGDTALAATGDVVD